MLRIKIINGPNLAHLGLREPQVYGATMWGDFYEDLTKKYEHTVRIGYMQSNIEGEIIDEIYRSKQENIDGIIINAGAYTHTSIAIHDAIRGVDIPAVEVHISNVGKRESFRHHSFLSPVVVGTIQGFGLDSYRLALEAIIQYLVQQQ